MVVLNAVRCNPWLRQYYERLRAAGKPGKVAVIAAMRKLLTAVWSVATHRNPSCRTCPLPSQPNVGRGHCRASRGRGRDLTAGSASGYKEILGQIVRTSDAGGLMS